MEVYISLIKMIKQFALNSFHYLSFDVVRLRSHLYHTCPIYCFVAISHFKPDKQCLCSRSYTTKNYKVDSSVAVLNSFSTVEEKTKDNYLDLLHFYKNKDLRRRGHVEFIYAALKHMKEFGVEKDLEVYKSLMDVMPKGKFVAQNIMQAEFQHYPKQQQCMIDLLEQMEICGE